MQNINKSKENIKLNHSTINHNVYHYDHRNGQVNIGIIDQYTLTKFLADILEEYEIKNNVRYDYIIKTRVDRMNFAYPIILKDVIEKYNCKIESANVDECLYFAGNDGWYTDCFFFGTHDAMVSLCKSFCEKLFFYDIDNTKKAHIAIFAPEVQIIYHCKTLTHPQKKIRVITGCVPKVITIKNPHNCSRCIKYIIS